MVLTGLSLTLIGLSLFLVSVMPVARIDEPLRTSFAVGPGGRYGPYDTGTCYHTRVFIYRSVLRGEVLVEGEAIYLTANGYNTQELRNVCVRRQMSFEIDPADDLYTFTFDNTKGSNESLVGFTLKEFWTGPMCASSPLLFIAGLIGIFVLLPTGLATLAISYLTASTRKSSHRILTQCSNGLPK